MNLIRPVGRRATLVGALATAAILPSARRARADTSPLRIGVLTDMSGWGRDNGGPGAAYAGSVLHYLKAVAAAKTTDAPAVMAAMREMPINDEFVTNGYLRKDGRVIRDMYLTRVKTPAQSKDAWDYFEIVRTIKGEDAYRPASESSCPLLKT